MSDVIGRGVIEVSADSSKLNATIAEARTRLKALGEAGKDSAKNASASIDRYIKNLENQNATLGKSKREIELYKLALKGATDAQLRAANAALGARDAWEKNQEALRKAADGAERHKERMKTAFLTIAAAAAAMAVAGAHYFSEFISQAADFQDMAEKTGDSAENLASLFVSAKVGGLEMSEVADAIVKLNNNLSGVDDESKAAGAALAALGLNIKDLKAMSGADQLEAIGKAFNQFKDSSVKATVATALFSKSGKEMLSFLKELGNEGGRQKLLTQEQIEQADDYADKQAKVRAQLSLQASVLAAKLLPEVTKFTDYLKDLAKNEDVVAAVTATMKGAMVASVTVFQTFALVGSDVAFTFRVLARDMDGFKRQAIALKNLDFKAIREIGREVVAADAADRARLDKFQKGIMALTPPELAPILGGKPKPEQKNTKDTKDTKGGTDTEGGGRTLVYTTPDADAKANAAKVAAERKAQTELDVEIIKQGSEKILNTYQNADRILQSRRQNNLISETEYYESKKELIRLDADEQARALTAEIARMEQEKTTGKERLQTLKKIEEARGKLSKVRENEAIALDLNASDQAASVRKIEQAYLDAATAAQFYIDTIKRQNARVVEGVGRGQKFRERQEGINAIEDKLLTRKNELDSDLRRKDITDEQYAAYLQVAKDTYSEETRLYNERTDAIERKNADALNGMTEALHNYADETKDIAGMTEHAFTNALSGIEDAFVTLATTGKLTFKDLVQSIHADLVRIGFRSLIGKGVDALLNNSGLNSLFGSVANAAGGAQAGGAKSAADVLGGATSALGGAGAVSGQAAQTAALSASTTALTASTTAVTAETASVTASTGAFTAQTGAATTATASLATLAGAADAAAAALASVGTSGAAGSGGGLFNLAGLFGGSGAGAGTVDYAAAVVESGIFHNGGIVGQASVTRTVPIGVFSGAARYHDGGTVAADGATAGAAPLALNEVPAILMGGPKGRREEVLRADDPRHIDNLGAAILAQIMAESRKGIASHGARALGGPVSSGGLYRVNERGPELLTVAGKEYLMLGQHGGDVSSTPTAAHGGGNTYLNVTVAPPVGTSRATAMQFGATAGRQMQIAIKRNG